MHEAIDPVMRIVGRIDSLGIEYMITGSVAVILYGAPRMTHDVDLVVELTRDQAERLTGAFPMSEYYCPPADVLTVEMAREQRGHFNIIEHATGFKADVYLAGRDPLHAWGLKRTRRIDVGGTTVVVAPPEYVIVRKLEYFREGQSEKHLRDIESMLRTMGDGIQVADLEPLLAERGLLEVWREVSDLH